ncbi:aldose 1-epimerase [Budvicia diplopodorum]|uniref:aldose 1-epimerase n=1 Tax=Budvicia diplopodorum TaxID=1119056 RepID=UPI00135C5BA9|nr:aldose 1-epimerase [Budvicia diplopodorum]
MTLFTLSNDQLELSVSSAGGAIEGFYGRNGGASVALLRPGKGSGSAIQSSCFPLVPFANRVNGNRFSFEGKTYRLTPNTEWDTHYLHGDGWLNEWQCLEHTQHELLLEYQHSQGIYRYVARQHFRLRDNELDVTLSVTNQGEDALPFGLGWHPYFPLTKHTTVQAKSGGYWLEEAHWLAGEHQTTLPADIDFNQPSPVPRRWVNNGFSGWDGNATIHWPEHQWSLTMETEPACPCYFIFVSDPAFDQGYDFDFFCLEPMSHAANDHNVQGAGGLKRLMTNDTLTQTMRLTSRPQR